MINFTNNGRRVKENSDENYFHPLDSPKVKGVIFFNTRMLAKMKKSRYLHILLVRMEIYSISGGEFGNISSQP